MNASRGGGVRLMTDAQATVSQGFASRWVTYQAERFPLKQHGPLILVFSAAAVSYSAGLRGAGLPGLGAVAVAFLSCLIFFAQIGRAHV